MKAVLRCDIPNCYHFGLSNRAIKSPRIPVILEGREIPMVIDTGAEVSLLSMDVVSRLCPAGISSFDKKQVTSLGGHVVTVRGPIEMTVEVCNLVLTHEFYCSEGLDQCILGFDLITAAALVIDSESGCVWSNHTLRHRVNPEDSLLPTLPYGSMSAESGSTSATTPSIDGSHLFELSHQLPPRSVTKHDKCEPTPVMVDKLSLIHISEPTRPY